MLSFLYVWGILVLKRSMAVKRRAVTVAVANRSLHYGVAVFLAVYRLLSADNKIIVLLQGLIQPMCFASF
jgi:hypothetical protein